MKHTSVDLEFKHTLILSTTARGNVTF